MAYGTPADKTRASRPQATNIELPTTVDTTTYGPNKQPINAAIKLSKRRLVLAFAIAGISDAIGAFATPLPPIVWVVDLATVLLLFIGAGRAMAGC